MRDFHNIELVLKFKCSSISEANHMAKQAMEDLGNTDETPLFKEAQIWIDGVKAQTAALNTEKTNSLPEQKDNDSPV